MWHEARKQEKMIRGMMVDYRRRAERRKDYYEKIRAEPAQFLQLHGRLCKIHLDPAIAAAGDSPAIMMPWQGDSDNLIDRFDVRAHLDYIPEVRVPDVPPSQLPQEERQINYERYRILAQNTFLGISEDKFLNQLAIEEQFGVTLEEKEAQKEKLTEKKTGVEIAYNYNNTDANPQPSTSAGPETSKPAEESDEDSDLEIIDVDLSIDVTKVEPATAHELNSVGPLYGLAGCDLFSFLTGDADDAELQKQRAREEKEKAMFSGRKSRRERRAHRDKKLATRVLSPPSYAAPDPNAPRQQSHSPSRSRSRSGSPAPISTGVTFITSFGGDDDEVNSEPYASKSKPLYADKVKKNLSKPEKSYSAAVRGNLRRSPTSQTSYKPRSPIRMGPHRPGSRTPSPLRTRSRSKSYRSRSRSFRSRTYRSRSRSYRSKSRSYRSKSRSYRSKSRSYRSKSRSQSRSRSRRSLSRPRRSLSRTRRSFSRTRRSFSRSRRSFSRSRSYSPRYRRSRSPSRSRSYTRRKRSPSCASNQSSDYARHNSRSMSVESDRAAPAPAPSVPRYYGRRKSDAKSSSEISLDSESSDDDTNDKSAVGVKPNSGQNQLRLTGSSSKDSSRQAGLSLKEKLKRKMAAQLARQLRADKKAAAERLERESQLQAQRDDEMRELALKMRRRNREQRHQNERHSSESDSKGSHSSAARKSPDSPNNREKRMRSLSSSPEPPKKIPVWETEVNAPSTSIEKKYNQPRPYDSQDGRSKPHDTQGQISKSNDYKEQRPKYYENQDRGPKSYENQDRGPKSYDNQDRGPKSYENQDRGPKSYENQDRGPKSYENQDRGPKSYENQDRGPKSNENHDRGPKSYDNQDRGPKSYENQDRSSKPYDNRDRGYDRGERSDRQKDYDRNYEPSYKQEDYPQNYSNRDERYSNHRPYANRRPYGRGHNSRPQDEYPEYDDKWEYETTPHRGRGSGRRPYGNSAYRGGYRRNYNQSDNYEGQSYDRSYDNNYESREYESRELEERYDDRRERSQGPSKTRKLVDY